MAAAPREQMDRIVLRRAAQQAASPRGRNLEELLVRRNEIVRRSTTVKQ
jgi:hypothetical protein